MKEFQTLLEKFVNIPSVSTDIQYAKDIEQAVQFLTSYTKKSGMQTKVIRGFGNPIIVARTRKDPKLKTILIYGHYDVQPASKADGWKSNPFTLTVKNGRFFARGSTDNKGQILMHLYTIAELVREKRLGYNVIFLIEGNEETGSPLLRTCIAKYKKELACDCILISDGELGRNDTPALEASFRGVANMEVTLETGRDDLHSGLFGGVVPNAGEELARIIGTFHDRQKNILVPGFYVGTKASKTESGKKINFKALTGTYTVFAETDTEYETKTGLLPAVETTTLSSGYMGTGFRNSVPSKAVAKINVRSAPGQDPEKLALLLKKFITARTPVYAKVTCVTQSTSRGAVLDTNNVFAQKAKRVLTMSHKKEIVTKHSGGTLPIVNDFAEILRVPQIMVPLANEDCGMHSASENISISAVKKGLTFSREFFSR